MYSQMRHIQYLLFNLLTKVEPFNDDFNDGDYTGWPVWSGTWDAASHFLSKVPGGAGRVVKANTDGSLELRFSYCNNDGSADYCAVVTLRQYSVGTGNSLRLNLKRDSMSLTDYISGNSTTLDSADVSSTEGTWYNIRIVCDGSNVDVWRAERGSSGPMELVLSTTSCTMNNVSYLSFWPQSSADFSFDNIFILANSKTTTTTFAYDTSDRMTNMTKDNMTTTFYYDYSGRQCSKNAQSGAHTASYTYRYDSKMCTASSSFPDESNLTLSYDGLGKLRQSAGGATNKYRWDAGWNLINIEASDGTLQNTVWYQAGQDAMAPLGMATGTNPSSGATWGYFVSDHINSVRETRLDDRTVSGEYEYTPYGNDYFRNGSQPAFGFKGNRHFDELYADYSASGLYFSAQANSDTSAQANSGTSGACDGWGEEEGEADEERDKPWTRMDYFAQYYGGNGEDVNLNATGMMDLVRNSNEYNQYLSYVIGQAELQSRLRARKKCEKNPDKTFTQETWFTFADQHLYDFSNYEDARVVLGKTLLKGGCLCGGRISCQTRKIRYGCVCGVIVDDIFQDPWSVQETYGCSCRAGTPYKMWGVAAEIVEQKTVSF